MAGGGVGVIHTKVAAASSRRKSGMCRHVGGWKPPLQKSHSLGMSRLHYHVIVGTLNSRLYSRCRKRLATSA